ncbi:hypothetical protein LCGC14_1726970 [marine sediment metagenome]|uniref:Uncharacterized protein n=1 Tax=marine sediment metagenome TaxID=412755 RepID=A0A0F9JRC2_9ZZZZ
MQNQENSKSTPPSFLATCNKCGHTRVCTVLRAIGPLMANWPEDSRPFEANQIASICKEFISDAAMQTLKGDNK